MKLPLSYRVADALPSELNEGAIKHLKKYPELRPVLLGILDDAVDFDFSAVELDEETFHNYFRYGREAARENLFRPPYEVTHIVWPYRMPTGVLENQPLTVNWTDDGRLVVIAYLSSSEVETILPVMMYVIDDFGKDTQSESMMRFFEPGFFNGVLSEEQFQGAMRLNVAAAIVYLSLLDSKQTVKRWEEFGKLNKSRAKKNLREIPPRCVVRLNLKSRGNGDSRPGIEGRAPPRLHRRRGHIRHLALKAIKIPPCIVGAEKGINGPLPRRTYKVSPGSVSESDAS